MEDPLQHSQNEEFVHVKTLVDQLFCLEVHVRDEVIVMTLLKSLLTSYEYLIIAMETMLMKALMIDYVMACLMHKMSKHKEKKPCCCNKTKAAIYFCIKV